MAGRLSQDDAERRRFRAAELLDQGHSQAKVAQMVGVARGTVAAWVKRREGGDDGLKQKRHPGRPRKLDDRQMESLAKLLLRGPRKLGYSTELWTLERVGQVIERRFGVTFDPSGVWHLLRRMGWSCQKPERRARERDDGAVAVWRHIDWPRIKKRAANS